MRVLGEDEAEAEAEAEAEEDVVPFPVLEAEA